RYPMLFEVGNFLFSAQFQIPYRRDDLHIWDDGLEDHVEAYLIVACTRAAMSDGGSFDLFGIFWQSFSLKYSCRAHRESISLIFQHITKNKVLDYLLIVS